MHLENGWDHDVPCSKSALTRIVGNGSQTLASMIIATKLFSALKPV